jgi:NAD(P)-dependent dehydrogenase (short-subunit alcohol dehydrogenase family)
MSGAYDLSGTVVMITGAAGGIGRETALAVARCGASVVLGDNNDEELEVTAEAVRGLGAAVATQHLDVRDLGQCTAFAALGRARFGRLDGALCVAGVNGHGTILTLTAQEWQRVLDINLTGTFQCVQAAAREMIACGAGGSIVTYSSGIVLQCPPWGTEYSTAKTGMLALTKSSAAELGPHGIRVNAIAPGVIRTSMPRAGSFERVAASAPLRRAGEPADLSGPACFLLSADSSYITGHTLHVNGGLVMA